MGKLFTILFVTFSLTAFAQVREDYGTPASRNDASRIQIFPNPAVDFVHVRIDDVSAHDVKLTVHNIIGNQVTVETEVIDEHEIRIRVKDLNAGYYLLAVKGEDERFKGTYKFLKR